MPRPALLCALSSRGDEVRWESGERDTPGFAEVKSAVAE